MLAVKLLDKGCFPRHPCHALVYQIKQSLRDAPNIRISHVLREANQVADLLAKHGLSLDARCYVFDNLPPFISLPCLANNAFVAFPRGF